MLTRKGFQVIVLDAKTDYSFLRGYGTPKQWYDRCKTLGVTHFAVVDYCSTWGHIPFREVFTDIGLLYGVQLPVVTYLDKDPRHSLVTLIAKAKTDELYRLSSLAHAQTYYRPRLTWKQIHEVKDCFVIVDECLKKHEKQSEGLWRSTHKAPRFPAPEDRNGFSIFHAMSDGQRIGEIGSSAVHLSRRNDEHYAQQIVDACKAAPPRATLLDMGVQGDKIEQLHTDAIAGAIRLGLWGPGKLDGWHDPRYGERLAHELSVIRDKDFADYFFFVADICSWASERMFIGPGRGSAGGSLLCYLLGITTVDPIKFGTLFERFIDVTRSDLPDIDIDFPDVRREEVFDYLRTKYGADHFARIGTLTELGGKSAINAAARATGVPYDVSRDVGRFAESGAQGVSLSPAWIFENVEEVKPILERHPSLRMATLIDGHVSHHGVHASGIVVTDDPVTRYGTVDREGVLSMDMRNAEKQGLVKMDALGLRTLSVIQETCDLAQINPRTLYDLSWNDTEVFDRVFNADRVTGIFQFEGPAVRQLTRQITVDKFDDLCALASLARPGPLIGGAAGRWAKARNGEAVGEMLHPALESTYGVIAYQEQFMAIARDVAGFDVGQVNGMRRAVAKKDPEKLRSFRNSFVLGAGAWFAKNRSMVDATVVASELWEEICEFGSYAFNYSHAVEYGMISYMTAWLKVKHPLEFAVAQLRNAADDDQAKALLRELSEEGYKYCPFDPMQSAASWSIVDGVLVGGFDGVRGIGNATALRLVAAREKYGPSFLDKLTAAQRTRIERAETPWHSLSYFAEKFATLYADPNSFRHAKTPKGIKPPVYRIRDIPEAKGNYAFLGRIIKKKLVDANEPERVAKRDGKKYTSDTQFINLTIEDDTGELGATINRFKTKDFLWVANDDMTGRDFLFRGNVIEAGRKWIFLDNCIEL